MFLFRGFCFCFCIFISFLFIPCHIAVLIEFVQANLISSFDVTMSNYCACVCSLHCWSAFRIQGLKIDAFDAFDRRLVATSNQHQAIGKTNVKLTHEGTQGTQGNKKNIRHEKSTNCCCTLYWISP